MNAHWFKGFLDGEEEEEEVLLDIDALLPPETVNRGASVARATTTFTTNPTEDPTPNRSTTNVQRQLQIDMHPRHTQVNPEPYGSRMMARANTSRGTENTANVRRQLQIVMYPRHTQVDPRMIARNRDVRRAENIARPGILRSIYLE